MLFMLLATDAEGTGEARAQARPAHLARLEELDRAGRLLTAGPNPLPDNPDAVSTAWTKPRHGRGKTRMSMPACMPKC